MTSNTGRDREGLGEESSLGILYFIGLIQVHMRQVGNLV